MRKVKNQKRKKINIFAIVMTIIFTLLTGFLVVNLIKLANIETLLRVIVIVVLCLILIGLIVFQKKRKMLCMIIMIILCLIYGLLNYTFYKLYTNLNSITKNVDTKGICLVSNNLEITNVDDMDDSDVAIVGELMDADFYQMAMDIVDDTGLSNELVEYDDYFQIINALLNDEIKYAFLPENYNDIYSANVNGEESETLKFSVLYTEQKLIESKEEIAVAKSLDEPFSVLLMGSDVLLNSYNADTLMVLTVNPKTMKVTMLSIPRDTYTTIACTGGKHKINSSGWYGDSCVVKTVGKYLDINIDYYAKINFVGIVDLVNVLGGVDVDVPYAFCEQNSKRQWGNNTVYVESGWQTLDGEKALALSRNRHYWSGLCPSKYTSSGNRSDLTRGQNQQLVIKAIINKLMTVKDINTFYGILDTIGNNMTTNMPKETILSLYNVGKNIVKRLNANNADDVMNIEKLALKSHFATVHISGLNLSMIVNYKESVDYVSKQMKKNLGLVESEVITKFSFDINEEYDPDSVKYSSLTSNLSVLSDLTGKTLGDALSYCSSKGLKCSSVSNDNKAIVVSQSIAPKTDLSIIKNKTIELVTETIPEPDKNDGNGNNNSGDNNSNTGDGATGSNEDKENNNDSGNNDDVVSGGNSGSGDNEGSSGGDDGTSGDNGGSSSDGGGSSSDGDNSSAGNEGSGSKEDDGEKEGDVSGED